MICGKCGKDDDFLVGRKNICDQPICIGCADTYDNPPAVAIMKCSKCGDRAEVLYTGYLCRDCAQADMQYQLEAERRDSKQV